MDLAPNVQSLVRMLYAALLCLWMPSLWRNRSRLFVSGKWNGYIQSDPAGDRIHNPFASRALLVFWTAAAVLLGLGVWPLAAAAVNYLLCRHYFIDLRWKTLVRGCGAPGFVAHWLAAAVLILELTSQPGTGDFLRAAGVWMLRFDFACIILSAGFYKFFSGYRSDEGMEYGMVNPMWGYWHRFWSSVPSKHGVFRLFNELAWSGEVVAGILMLIPATMGWGGLLLAVSFIFILTQIRLGFLCHMVIVVSLLYAAPADIFTSLVPGWGFAELVPDPPFVLPQEAQAFLGTVFIAHGLLLAASFAGLWFNQLRRKKLPGPLQPALEAYTNAFGIIIWRVFVSDLTRFEVTVWAGSRQAGWKRVSYFGEGAEFTGRRYLQVYESITAACLFTTLNYFPDRRGLFHEKLVRYARTIPGHPAAVRFDIEVIEKKSDRYVRRPAASYEVDLGSGTVTENELDPHWIRPSGPTLLRAGQHPGSYAPGR